MYFVLKMNKTQHKKFINTIKLVLLHNQLIGLITFNITDSNFKLSKFRLFFNLTASIILLPFAIYNVYLYTIINLTTVFKSTAILEIFTHSTFIITVWMTGVFNYPKISDFLNNMIKLEEKFYNVGLPINRPKEKKRIEVHFIIRNLILLAFFLAFPWHKLNDLISHLILLIFVILKSGVCFQTIEFISIIRNRYKTLNNYTDCMISKFRDEVLLNLCKSCDLHHRLSKLITQFNKTFGFLLLLMSGSTFLVIVLAIFYLAAYTPNNPVKWSEITLMSFWCLTFVVDILSVCNECYNTVQEVFFFIVKTQIKQINFRLTKLKKLFIKYKLRMLALLM